MHTIWEMINEASTIGIAGHIRPDGDCVGACMGLYGYLLKEYPEKQIDVYLEFVPERFQFLKLAKHVITETEEKITYDLFIALDGGDVERLGLAKPYFETAKQTICIDHHISNTKFADYNFIEPELSSTCELLYTMMQEEKIDHTIAEALYLGIVHDTGVFKHTNTTKQTMEIAGKLIEKGVAFSNIIDETFYQKTYMQNQILGRCLLESILLMDGKCIVSYMSQKIMAFYEADSSDLDGIIDQLRITKGVEVAILIHEVNPMEQKVSMRSNGIVDVSKIAVYFGGGGHKKAAGYTMKGSVYDVVNNLTIHIETQLKQEK